MYKKYLESLKGKVISKQAVIELIEGRLKNKFANLNKNRNELDLFLIGAIGAYTKELLDKIQSMEAYDGTD